MTNDVAALWGEELAWIKDDDLRDKTAKTWELALERSVLTADDLNIIPSTSLVPDLKVTFMAHKRAVVHIAKATTLRIPDHLPLVESCLVVYCECTY